MVSEGHDFATHESSCSFIILFKECRYILFEKTGVTLHSISQNQFSEGRGLDILKGIICIFALDTECRSMEILSIIQSVVFYVRNLKTTKNEYF